MLIEWLLIMVVELTELVNQTNKATQIDLSKVDTLSDELHQTTTQLKEVIKEGRKPIIREQRTTIVYVSKKTTYILIVIVIIIAGLSSGLRFAPPTEL